MKLDNTVKVVVGVMFGDQVVHLTAPASQVVRLMNDLLNG